jgi:F-type H+-transporting ATPase subunit delta
MSLIERRYAEALIAISSQAGTIDEYREELHAVVDIYKQQEDFRRFLLDPQIRAENKKNVVKSVFGSRIKDEIVNFLRLLLDKGRMAHLPGILEEYNFLADRKKNVLNMTIITAAPLSAEQVSRIKEKYKVMHKAYSVKADIEVDPSLIGGMKIKIGDKVEDGSIKGRLQGLKEILLK